jgi:UTP:GlnB (protein PII) uridylyltransferase
MGKDKTLFETNMEMWEKWTGSYMDTMFKTMEKTMEQSAAFRKQLDKAAATAASSQLEGALAAIKSLEEQVQTLSGKVDELLQEED